MPSRVPDERLAFLCRVTDRQSRHLSDTDARLFANAVDAEFLGKLEDDPIASERVEAFASRLARLQDTLGHKLLPLLLDLSGENTATVLENLDRAEKLGWIDSADDWMALRRLRNHMVHEYVEDLHVLADALNTGHRAVPQLMRIAQRLIQEARKHCA